MSESQYVTPKEFVAFVVQHADKLRHLPCAHAVGLNANKDQEIPNLTVPIDESAISDAYLQQVDGIGHLPSSAHVVGDVIEDQEIPILVAPTDESVRPYTFLELTERTRFSPIAHILGLDPIEDLEIGLEIIEDLEIPMFETPIIVVPTDKAAIAGLKRVREEDLAYHVNLNPDEACSICLEELSKGEGELCLTPCDHAFHEGCVVKWFEINHYCPLCRFELPSAKEL